jgi:hypothetical protein
VRKWEAEYAKASMRWQAWHLFILSAMISGLALLSLPLRQAFVVVPLVALSIAVVRKHGRRDTKDRPRNRR